MKLQTIRKSSKKQSQQSSKRRKNPVYITDPKALDIMTEIEGEWWKNLQVSKKTDKKDFTGFYYALKSYSEFLQKLKDAEDDEERDWLKDMYHETIYGAGGWHRYYVRGDGKIIFSKHHSGDEEKINLAKKLGFDIE